MESIEIPEGWTVDVEEWESPRLRNGPTPPPGICVDVGGPSDQLSPAERLSICIGLADQAAKKWAEEKGLGAPRFSAAKQDDWPADGRFVQTRFYTTAAMARPGH